jgi:predicted DNA-binding transcriptional regulator AlpA
MGESEALLLDLKAVAKMLSLSERKVRSLRSAGNLPAPVTTLGRRCPRWRRRDLETWVARGCPRGLR